MRLAASRSLHPSIRCSTITTEELSCHFRAQHEWGREGAARAVVVSLKLAAFHLDRLVEAEMLAFGYRPLSDGNGPNRAG